MSKTGDWRLMLGGVKSNSVLEVMVLELPCTSSSGDELTIGEGRWRPSDLEVDGSAEKS
jgi:hypothetical protein